MDCCVDSMSGMTSQGSMGAIVNAVRGTALDTGIQQKALSEYNSFWELTRRQYAPFECTTTMRSGNSDVFLHEIPGGQYTNLQFQSVALNLADKFAQVCENYRQANIALGDIIKVRRGSGLNERIQVTPSSKVTGDLTQVMTQRGINSAEELVKNADEITFPNSVVEFFEGKLGQPYGGFPTELREKVLRGKKTLDGRPGASLSPMDFDKVDAELAKKFEGKKFDEYERMSSIMFPLPFAEMVKFREEYGPVDKISTDVYFAGPEEFKEYEVGGGQGGRLIDTHV